MPREIQPQQHQEHPQTQLTSQHGDSGGVLCRSRSGVRVVDAGGIGFSHEEKWSYATSKKVNGTGENPIKRIKTDLES
ncbi:rCG59535, partial [Rattus norvegicus]